MIIYTHNISLSPSLSLSIYIYIIFGVSRLSHASALAAHGLHPGLRELAGLARIYIYIYIYMYICMYVYIYIYIYTCD